MYELWVIDRRDEETFVSLLGTFPTVDASRRFARGYGPGRYRVCNSYGEVARFRVRPKARWGF